MKIRIVFAFLFSSWLVSAQTYYPLITPGKQSVFFFDCSFCPFTVQFCNQYYFDGDTNISGNSYAKLYAQKIRTYWSDTTDYLAALLREDTASGIVFKYASLPQDTVLGSSFGTEVEFWNYNKQVGDTIHLIYPWDGSILTEVIDNIDTITLINQQRVRQFKNKWNIVLYTEGLLWSDFSIDNISHGLSPSFCRGWTGYNQLLYQWAASPCQYNYINLQENAHAELSIHPNPASDYLVLNTRLSGDFELYNLLGNLVLNSRIASGDQKKLSVANLPAGMYVWIYETAKGVEKGKLVID